MNRRQRAIIAECSTVIVVTVIAVLAMVNVKDLVNRSEAIKAMNGLNGKIRKYQDDYRSEHSSYYETYPEARAPLPAQSYIDSVKNDVKGSGRLGELKYRAVWLGLDATDDDVLAYSRQRYRSWLVRSGYVVLRFDGRVEWMETNAFEELFAEQQSPQEIEMMGP